MKRSRENPSADNGSTDTGADSADKQPNDATGFIGRWSRRKRDVALDTTPGTDPDLTTEPDHALQQTVTSNDVLDDSAGDAVLTDVDMPDVETLNADSDFSPFFSKGVSKELRNLALKKLFFSGKFSVRDGLDDYDDDFTKFEPLGDTITSDMKFHARRKEKARLAALEEEKKLRLESEGQTGNDEQVAAATTDESVAAEVESDEAETSSVDQQRDVADSSSISEVQSDSPNAETDSADAEAVPASDKDQRNV